ncbi:MAG: manganese efflux pump MntP family protein [Oceanobacter sp.]
MLEIILLAIGLSMDAFAVAIGLGARKHPNPWRLSLTAGVYFGLFQALMPMIGYWAGRGALSWVQDYSHWIAFVLLVAIGGKMLWESFQEGIEDDIQRVSHRVLLMLAIATSIDAMAAGFALNLLEVSVLVACAIIGLITFAFSVVGVQIGLKTGALIESRAEQLGGLVLIGLGFRFLLG